MSTKPEPLNNIVGIQNATPNSIDFLGIAKSILETREETESDDATVRPDEQEYFSLFDACVFDNFFFSNNLKFLCFYFLHDWKQSITIFYNLKSNPILSTQGRLQL